ncbi:formin-2-like [Diachasma alloeum]|uniref:formin-2-like n=1 Tax=Diachasma alloeum TaxID=454923 RepID=UPI0007382CA7|nr:formin-2-like [Diachasma alloeum]
MIPNRRPLAVGGGPAPIGDIFPPMARQPVDLLPHPVGVPGGMVPEGHPLAAGSAPAPIDDNFPPMARQPVDLPPHPVGVPIGMVPEERSLAAGGAPPPVAEILLPMARQPADVYSHPVGVPGGMIPEERSLAAGGNSGQPPLDQVLPELPVSNGVRPLTIYDDDGKFPAYVEPEHISDDEESLERVNGVNSSPRGARPADPRKKRRPNPKQVKQKGGRLQDKSPSSSQTGKGDEIIVIQH